MVEAGSAFQSMTEVLRKFVPFTVRVNVEPPATAVVGEVEVMVGLRLSMVKVSALEVPPPGPLVTTVTGTVPAVVTSDAEMEAVSLALLTNVVVKGEPFQFTREAPLTKFEPFTVRVNVALPAVLLVGEKVVRAGAGLLIVKVCAFEAPPPGAGFETVMLTVPAVAMSVVKIAAVTFVALTKVVVRLEWFHKTVVPFTKFVPFTVRVNAAPPAVALIGESDEVEGTGLSTEKLTAFDGATPGLTTVTGNVPPVAMSVARTVAVS